MAKGFTNPKIKLLSFQKDLQILLEEYGYKMGAQLNITKQGITPVITVDTPPQPQPVPTKVEEKPAKIINKDAKKEEPIKESEKDIGKN